MIRLANIDEVEIIMTLINKAKLDFKIKGINQWQDGYPNELVIKEDISNKQAYVLVNDHIDGYFYLSDYEETYDKIDGKWLTSERYLVVHRLVIDLDKRGQGLANYIMEYLFKMASSLKMSIRVDTHQDNKAMIAMLLKHGFKYCGVIKLMSNEYRNAYEKTK